MIDIYCVEYDDGDDSGMPVTYWHTRAYSAEHALEKFEDGDEGFRALRVARVDHKKPRHRWKWVRVCGS